MHIMFAGNIFLLSFGCPESPRYLVKIHERAQARESLCKLRNLSLDHGYIAEELAGIMRQLNEEEEATRGAGWWAIWQELLGPKQHNLYRIQIGIMSQLLGQWSGANSITI